MVTGRDLIVYILQNGLEDKPVFDDGKLLGFMTPSEAATKFNVGLATIYIWAQLDMLPGITIGEALLIPADAERPNDWSNL